MKNLEEGCGVQFFDNQGQFSEEISNDGKKSEEKTLSNTDIQFANSQFANKLAIYLGSTQSSEEIINKTKDPSILLEEYKKRKPLQQSIQKLDHVTCPSDWIDKDGNTLFSASFSFLSKTNSQMAELAKRYKKLTSQEIESVLDSKSNINNGTNTDQTSSVDIPSLPDLPKFPDFQELPPLDPKLP